MKSSIGGAGPSPVAAALTVVLVAAIVIVPLWSVAVPPLHDYPNHLARQFILAGLPDSPVLQTFYAANWRATPYLAVDAVTQGLAHFLPVDVAGRVFLTLMLLLLALAPLALNWANFGRVTPIALLGLLFVHNRTVNWGFVSYLFGVGFGLCLLALWIRWREGGAAVRLAFLPLAATLLFFSHLLGYVVYGLTAAAYELGRHVAQVSRRRPMAPWRLGRDQWINLLSLAMQLLVPLSLFLAHGPSTGSVSSNMYGGLGRKFELLLGIFTYLMPPYAWRWDAALSLLIPAALVVLLLMRRLTVSRPMLWPIGALLVMFFATPMQLFGGWGADHRLLTAIGLMLVGSIRLRTEGWRPAPFVATALVALVAVRVVTVTAEWRRADADYAEFLRAFDSISDGSRMYFAFGETRDRELSRRPYRHLPTLVLMKRQAFVPYLFAGNSGVGPLRYRPEVEPLRRIASGEWTPDGLASKWPDIIAAYDYVFLVDARHFNTAALSQLVPVFKGTRVTVYKTPRIADDRAKIVDKAGEVQPVGS